MDKVKDCEKRLTYLAEVRSNFEDAVDMLLTYFSHGRRKVSDTSKGKTTGLEVYDDVAVRAKNMLVDGMTGYLVSRSMRWFSYTLPLKFNFPRTSSMRKWSGKRMDEYPEVREYLADCEDVVYQALSRSNFYDVTPEFIGDGAVVGTAHLIIEEDVGNGRLVFTVPHFRECYISENQYGVVDTNYRVYNLTLQQLVQKFGMEALKKADPAFEKNFENNPYTEREVLHVVCPREHYDRNRMDKKNLPVESLWILRGQQYLLEESGYEEMPVITWRWRKNSDEWYGRSPAWDAIIAVLTAQDMGKTNMVAGHKMADPPMVGPSDMRNRVKNVPGGWTWVDSIERQTPRPMVTGIQLPYAVEQQNRIDEAIKEHMHVNFFLMLYQAAFNKVDLTATQVLGMQGEQAAVLGTRVGRLESEAFNPLHDRVFGIESRAGRIPDPPDILREYIGNARIEVDYLGPLAQSQRRLTKTRELRAGLESAAALAQIFPESVDIVDGDQAMKVSLEVSGFPPSCILPDDRVANIREMRSRERGALLQAEIASKVGKIVPELGKAPEPGSPLSELEKAL